MSDSASDEGLLNRHRRPHEANFDITAMIDLVFMLNIFFLVTTAVAAQMEMDLPIVRHCIPTDPEEAVMISLVGGGAQPVAVTINDDQRHEVTDPDQQIQMVRRAVEEASQSGKKVILIKAERAVKLRDVKRIGSAATKDIKGMELRMAVIERS